MMPKRKFKKHYWPKIKAYCESFIDRVICIPCEPGKTSFTEVDSLYLAGSKDQIIASKTALQNP
jgi:hypothetical protein